MAHLPAEAKSFQQMKHDSGDHDDESSQQMNAALGSLGNEDSPTGLGVLVSKTESPRESESHDRTHMGGAVPVSIEDDGDLLLPRASPDLASNHPAGTDHPSEDQGETAFSSEIQSIMRQFKESGLTEKEAINERMEGANLDTAQHPPRRSSLQPLDPSQFEGLRPTPSLPVVPTLTPEVKEGTSQIGFHATPASAVKVESPSNVMSFSRQLPPAPEPEPDLPFDFHRFLEQLRHRTADPVARYLRSFLNEFGKKSWMVHEQVKFIHDFLFFISKKMAQCEVWRDVSGAEFDNAREGMEKLVMNRLYNQTFSPVIPPLGNPVGQKGKKKNIERSAKTGRRGQHQEDVERDEILSQKMRIYGWVQEEHLDIRPVEANGRRLLSLAQQELLKINSYRAPRDKIICFLNCCKVIFGLLRNAKSSDTSADAFMPLLIYVVLHANPEHLISNLNYILRFRNQEKLGGEVGYYMSSLMGAVSFVENLDRTSLTISDEDFERNAEAAVSVIAERQKAGVDSTPRLSDASAQASVEERQKISRYASDIDSELGQRQNEPNSLSNVVTTADNQKEGKAVDGLLRSIQRPLSNLGKIFTDGKDQEGETESWHPFEGKPDSRGPASSTTTEVRSIAEQQTPQRLHENLLSQRAIGEGTNTHHAQNQIQPTESPHEQSRNGFADVVETLAAMFPNLEKDVIGDVVRLKQGRVGLAVDACLALNT